MTTDIERYEEQPSSTTGNLVEWAAAARAANQVARVLVTTAFSPPQFRGKPEEATAAILAGTELGLDPMASLNAFDVISGRAAPRAITLRAVVQAAGHEVWVEVSTPERVVMAGRRKGSTEVQRSEWTIERARQLGVTGKDNWVKQPQAMLVARGTSEICRLIAADAILGIPYSTEELRDSERTPEPVRRAPAPRAINAAKPAPVPTEPGEETSTQVVDEETGEVLSAPATIDQLNRIKEAAAERGVPGPAELLADIGGYLTKFITTSGELTSTDADLVLANVDTIWPVDEVAA